MEKRNGFLWLVSDTAQSLLAAFGPSTGQSDFAHENVVTNGLVLWPSAEATIAIYPELISRFPEAVVELGHLSLSPLPIDEARTASFSLLEPPSGLVVIVTTANNQYEVIGHYIEGSRRNGYLPGASFWENGQQPFREWQSAINCVEQYSRQTRLPAVIATVEWVAIDLE